LDIVEKNWPRTLKGSRVGLVVHPASVNKKLEHAADCFFKSGKFELAALFGPQHGIRGETQDNMIEWKGFRKKDRTPVYSSFTAVHANRPFHAERY
jgi:uncharacterized protein YbbC (DUF1343 family)